MNISDLEFTLVEMAHVGSQQRLRRVLVRLATDSGLEGWGESELNWRAAELSARRDVLLPVLAGRSIFDIEELHTLEPLSPPPLRCAVEMAFWDLMGRFVGQPLCHLLGGSYRRQVPLAVRLSGHLPERLTQLARELAEQGFHCQIVACSGQAELDLNVLRAVRENLGDRAEMRLDGLGKYNPEAARLLCAELENDGLQCFIDPLSTAEIHAMGALARQTSVPLGVWRAIHGPGNVLAAVRCGAAPFAVVDLQQVGGISPARKCAAIAEAGGMCPLLGGGPSLGVATAAMLHLAASTPAFSSGNECNDLRLQDDVLTEPLEVADGMMGVPQGPGLGVEVSRAKLERYQVT